MWSSRSHSSVFTTLCLLIYAYLLNTVTSDRNKNRKDTHHNAKISLDNFPNPSSSSPSLCGRGHKSFICDPNNFLKPEIADEIDEIIFNATKSNLVWCETIAEHDTATEGAQPSFIANPEEKTRENYNGLQIGVAIISSFQHHPHSRLRRDDDIAKKSSIYAKSIHDQWGVGEAGCNNAALIFINIYDRYLYVSTGSGIKRIIDDAFIDKFIIPKYVKPLMRASKYGAAVKIIVESMVQVLRHSDNLQENALYKEYVDFTKPAALFGIEYETWFIVILVLSGVAFLGHKFHSERDYRECERKLAQLYAQKQAKKFAASSCPICLEEFAAAPAEDTGDSPQEKETAVLICGHKFCKSCLDSWFDSQSAANQKCPICRHDRDDWSAARNDGNDQKQNDEVDEKKQADEAYDEQSSRDDFGPSAAKTSTSDSFYDNEEHLNSNANVQSGNGFGFRRRRNRGMGMHDWMFRQELMFRMGRMRYFYPRYISQDMTNRWNRADYSGSFTSDQSFVRSNPNYRAPASRSGSSWSSGRSSGFSFGGGSSRGGGGGGGGW